MQAPVPTLAVVTYPPGALTTQPRIVIDGVRGAIFVYTSGGPLGALVGSWASTAGTDPYGNVYPQGFSVNIGTLSGVTLNFANGYINANGFFLYSGTPAAGNLIATFTFATGTDSFGNKYLSGATVYTIIAGITYAINLSLPSGQGFPGFSVVDINHLPFAAPGVFAEASSGATPNAFAVVASGQITSSDVAAYISVLSQAQAGPAGGQIVLQAGDTQFDINGNLYDWTALSTGELIYTSNIDSNQYNVGTVTRHATALPQTITATTNQTITGLSANIYPGLYEMEVNAQFHGLQAAGAPQFQILQSSGTIINRWGNGIIWDTGTGTNRFVANTGNMIYGGPVMSTNEWVVFLKGFFQCTVAGAIEVDALTSIAADHYVIDNAMFTLRRRS